MAEEVIGNGDHPTHGSLPKKLVEKRYMYTDSQL
jgi:hypothetical protein